MNFIFFIIFFYFSHTISFPYDFSILFNNDCAYGGMGIGYIIILIRNTKYYETMFGFIKNLDFKKKKIK